jgi:hypothetical protein
MSLLPVLTTPALETVKQLTGSIRDVQSLKKGSLAIGKLQHTIVFTNDVETFWDAYDQVVKYKDTLRQAAIIRERYFKNADEGVTSFISVRGLKAMDWVRSINRYPKFWQSVRKQTLDVKSKTKNINLLMQRFRILYQPFSQPVVYCIIGNMKTGGVTQHERILIGAEITMADSTVNTEGLSPFMKEVFRLNKGIDYLVAHEAVHSQQKGIDDPDDSRSNLLGYSIREGACDFIAELLLRHPVVTPYMIYGRQHESELWKKFRSEMYGKEKEDWLYNGGRKKTGLADLGYFIGYQICRSYYLHSKNRRSAIKEIIEIDYADLESLKRFLERSAYHPV